MEISPPLANTILLMWKARVLSRMDGSEADVALDTATSALKCVMVEKDAIDSHRACIEIGPTELAHLCRMNGLSQARVWFLLGDVNKSFQKWRDAIQCLEKGAGVLEEYAEAFKMDSRDENLVFEELHALFLQLIRCHYELGDYDKAISVGKKAFAMGKAGRHKCEFHKCMALSYKARGDIEAAIKVMNRGVLYSLDSGDREEAYELYQELLRGE